MACAGKFLTDSTLPAPKYCETIDDIALRVCPNTQINIDKNVETTPTAAKDSVAFIDILPIIAASVNDKIGSETPDINAGMASLLICFKEMVFFTIPIRNNEKDTYFAWENKYHLIVYSPEVRKTFGFFYSVKRYLI